MMPVQPTVAKVVFIGRLPGGSGFPKTAGPSDRRCRCGPVEDSGGLSAPGIMDVWMTRHRAVRRTILEVAEIGGSGEPCDPAFLATQPLPARPWRTGLEPSAGKETGLAAGHIQPPSAASPAHFQTPVRIGVAGLGLAGRVSAGRSTLAVVTH